MVNDTTIKISKELREKLDKLKLHPKESYNLIIERLFLIARQYSQSLPKFTMVSAQE